MGWQIRFWDFFGWFLNTVKYWQSCRKWKRVVYISKEDFTDHFVAQRKVKKCVTRIPRILLLLLLKSKKIKAHKKLLFCVTLEWSSWKIGNCLKKLFSLAGFRILRLTSIIISLVLWNTKGLGMACIIVHKLAWRNQNQGCLLHKSPSNDAVHPHYLQIIKKVSCHIQWWCSLFQICQ